MEEQRLEAVLHEAEMSEDTEECASCRIAAGIGIAKNLCEEFKGHLDCAELYSMLDKPEAYTLDEIHRVVKKIADRAPENIKELLDYTTCLMEGRCTLSPPPE